jgi:hypothetical protein
MKDLRIEILQGSSLPAKLVEFGYEIRHSGTGTRLMPGGVVQRFVERGAQRTRLHDGAVAVDIIEISLSGK